MAKKDDGRLTASQLKEAADEYRGLALQARELEARMKPLRDKVAAHCRALGLTESLDLGAVMVVPTVRATETVRLADVSPDWLWRFGQAGGRLKALKLDTGPDDEPAAGMRGLLDEVGWAVKTERGYALRIKP